MASSPTMSEKSYHVRSVSLPFRSHPLMLKVEQKINKLRMWEASPLKAETVCSGLSGLKDLYNCFEDLLQLPLTRQAVAHHQQEKWVEESLDGSLRLLDMCGTLRDVSLQMKEHVQHLQSARRRGRSGESGNGDKYICSSKKMKKELSKHLELLKRMNHKFDISSLLGKDQHLLLVIRVLGEVRMVTIFIFQSIFSFMDASMTKKKPSKWAVVSKLMHKEQLICEAAPEDDNNERLRELEVGIEGIEDGLECVFRHLIQTRVNLLNVFTH